MKYNLAYSYSTQNYHVYLVVSKDPKKHGRKVYLPRENGYNTPLWEISILIQDELKDKKYARVVVKDEAVPSN